MPEKNAINVRREPRLDCFSMFRQKQGVNLCFSYGAKTNCESIQNLVLVESDVIHLTFSTNPSFQFTPTTTAREK